MSGAEWKKLSARAEPKVLRALHADLPSLNKAVASTGIIVTAPLRGAQAQFGIQAVLDLLAQIPPDLAKEVAGAFAKAFFVWMFAKLDSITSTNSSKNSDEQPEITLEIGHTTVKIRGDLTEDEKAAVVAAITETLQKK